MKRKSTFLLMTVPAIMVFFIFHTFPALKGIFFSFTDWKGYGEWDFVGFSNYLNVFKDSRVGDSYIFTFKFAIISTVIVNVLSLIIAMGLNSKIKFQKTFRAIYFIPYVLGMLIIGFIFRFIFSQLVPAVGDALDIEILKSSILGNPSTAWIGIVIVSVWQALAFNTLLYLSGLVTIPEELYEAASIDGAGSWKRFWFITFPMITPFLTINLILAMRNFLMAFDQMVAMTGGGPGRATETISLVIYKGGFEGGEFAYQSANAVLYFIVLATVALLQLKISERMEAKYQ